MGLSYRPNFLFMPIDTDNDGKQDAMVWRNVNGQRVFFVRRSSDGQMYSLAWGAATGSFFPLFGDYDGDGKTDFVSRQNISGAYYWHIFQSSTQTHRTVNFGQQGDQIAGEPQGELPVGNEGLLEFK
jgi:hypothetical protein